MNIEKSSSLSQKKKKKARVLAFYLPQFHPIPENNKWWGKGFTEWTNVTKAKPLFKGHHQPNLPSDLGFYDLRVSETREAQAELAKEHGIEGFCYWHYWFSGKRLLERPFIEVLKSGRPDFPFCLGWANATWTGIWYGVPEKILIKQDYPGIKDYEQHFYSILGAFVDNRYITVDGKPVFLIFHPIELPNPLEVTDIWRKLALKSGLKGLYLIGINSDKWNPKEYGFDACCVDYFPSVISRIDKLNKGFVEKVLKKLFGNSCQNKIFWNNKSKPAIYSYKQVIRYAYHNNQYKDYQYPYVMPNWDNTPRSQGNGVVFKDSTPYLFGKHFEHAISLVKEREWEKKIVFIKSWNEWAEGNYLEPDYRFGRAYLEEIKHKIFEN